MGHRSIILLLGALLAVASPHLMALGLGKIKLDSSLNQPLVAEIELFEVRELQKEEIRVAIASREDFERIGVDKIYFLSDLSFDVVLRGSSSYIKVTSDKAVREPFLNFVVQVQWPSGKLLREYTLLMDLPAFSDVQAPPVQPTVAAPSAPSVAPSVSQPSPGSVLNPRSEFSGAPVRPSSQPVSPTYTGDTYTVQPNDTLWEIADSVRPDASVTVHQAMIAIQRNNPQAFISNNINLLKKGQILRIPDRDDMATLGNRDAVSEVATQNRAWSGQAPSSEVSDAQLSGTDVYDEYEADSGTPEGRLKLASPDESFESSEGRTTGGTANVSTEALENELAIALEQLDKTGRDNSDLKSKVSSLEEQMSTMELMIEAKNRELEALQASIRKSQGEAAIAEEAELSSDLQDVNNTLEAANDDLLTEAPSDQLLDDTETTSEDTSSLNDLYGTESSDEASDGSIDGAETPVIEEEPLVEDTTAAIEEEQAESEAPKVAPVAPPVVDSGKSIVEIILDNVLYILGGVVVLAAGAFFLMRQKNSDEEDFDDFLNQQGLHEESPEPQQAQEEDIFEEDIDLGSFGEEPEEPFVPPEETFVEPEAELESESEPQTEDVVAEADIYIAYGKFDQAEEMLLNSLASDPGDHNVRLKLLEVYSTQGDVERFDPHFAQLREVAPPTSIERAENLRSNIPNVADFDESGFDTSDVTRIKPAVQAEPELEDIGLDLGGTSDFSEDSLGLDLPSDDGLELDLPETEPSTSLEDDFDLGLDLPDDLGSLDAELDSLSSDTSTGSDDLSLDLEADLAGGSEPSSPELADDLDFDLSLDDAESGSLEADLASLDAELDLSVSLDTEASVSDEVSGDTLVNEALNDEYIEQKLSEDAADEFDLEDELPLEDAQGALAETNNLEVDDLDLSSLDDELDALTSGVSADDSATAMDGPETDFASFEEELTKEDSLAETMRVAPQSVDVEKMGEESMFDQAISEVPNTEDGDMSFELPEIDPNDLGDDDLEFLSDSDETATKLDLARAYIDMGDQEGARDIIREVMGEGNDQQKSEAEVLLARIDG